MRFATYRHPGSAQDRVGVMDGGNVHAGPPGLTLLGILQDPDRDLATAGDDMLADPAEVVALQDVDLRAPIPRPPSVRDFLAFEEHARNARAARGLALDPDWYELPIFYFTNPAAIKGPHDVVAMAPGTTAWDYELEVAVIVGHPASDLHTSDAEAVIAGYCVLGDFSARDLQAREMRLGLGPAKGKDTATSLGPFLVTPDELEPHRIDKAFNLTMTASVNGVEQSRGTLAALHWSFGEMLAYASRGTTLQPGDVIGSGTVGTGCLLELRGLNTTDPPPWLQPGDRVSLEVENLGTLEHTISPSEPIRPLRSARADA